MNDVKIVKLLPEHANEVAKLHVSGICTGFISSLGTDFVTFLYEAIAESESGFGFVALMDNRVVGFSSFTTDVNALYKSVIFRNGVKFVLALSKKIFSWNTAKAVFETLFYPKRVKKMNLPSAEFLSMVVTEEARGKGLATTLMRRGFHECAKNGIEKIKILAAVHIKPINKLYEKNGFDLVAQIKNHGILSNIYVTSTDDKKRAEAKIKGNEFKQ
jgi:GNAT superfamily N-acetyltransferase